MRIRLVVGSNIRRIREELGLSQTELAKRVGVSRQATISDWERGENEANFEYLEKIADALGCEVKDLFEDHDLKPSRAVA